MPSTSSQDAPGVDAFHPGPFQFVLFAPLYALSGWSQAAIIIESLALNLGLVAISLWAAWKIDVPAAKFTAVTGNMIVILGLQTVLMVPWNPRPVEVGMIAMIMLAWAILIGRRGCWPWFVFVTAVIAQGHLVGLPVVWFLFGVMLLFGLRFGFPRAPAVTEIGAGVVVFAIAWALPIFDTIVNWPGNIGEIIAYMLAGSSESGTPDAAHVAEWKKKLYLFGGITVAASIRGMVTLRSKKATRKSKEWAAGALIIGLVHTAPFAITYFGGADRLLYNHMFNGLFWLGLLLLIPWPILWWQSRVIWIVSAIMLSLASIISNKTDFAGSVSEFREHGQVSVAAAKLVENYPDTPIVVGQDGSYAWFNLYSATILKLIGDGHDVYYDPIGPASAFDPQRRTGNINGTYIEILISTREGGIPSADRFDPDNVIASRVLDLESSEFPVTLTLVRVGDGD